jgi:hypothetical protein
MAARVVAPVAIPSFDDDRNLASHFGSSPISQIALSSSFNLSAFLPADNVEFLRADAVGGYLEKDSAPQRAFPTLIGSLQARRREVSYSGSPSAELPRVERPLQARTENRSNAVKVSNRGSTSRT